MVRSARSPTRGIGRRRTPIVNTGAGGKSDGQTKHRNEVDLREVARIQMQHRVRGRGKREPGSVSDVRHWGYSVG